MLTSLGLVSGVALFAIVLAVIFIVFKIGKFLIGFIANTILGFISLFIVNAVAGLGIPFDTATFVIVAITGLPGVLVLIILKLLGISP